MRSVSTAPAAILLLLLLVSISACDEFLDEQPFSQTSDAQFWQNNNDAAAGVAAIYDAMQRTYRTKHFLWGEIRADNHQVTDRVSVSFEELVTNNITPNNANALRWNDLYTMIGRANLAIQRIPEIPSADQNLLGEAHIMRAYAYFDAIRVWGDVPLFTEPVAGLGGELSRPRTDAATIMNEVILPDMLRAEELINIPAREFRWSRAGVWAFQADVYAWRGEWDMAKAALDKIIALGEYELVRDRDAWQKLFLNDENLGSFQEGPELIFSIQYDLLEDGNAASGVWSVFFTGIPSLWLKTSLETDWIEKYPIDSVSWVMKYPDFEPQEVDEDGNPLYGDWRYYESRETGRTIGEARLAKYNKMNFLSAGDATNIPVYRYAHVLLFKALAENRLGNPATAIELVNQVRTARQLPTEDPADYADATRDEIEKLVLQERQFELVGEGYRWWDLRVTDRAVEVLDTVSNMTEQTLLFPLFENHLIDNDLLTQNPGY